VYKVPLGLGKLKCPFPLCKGELANGYVMRQHFWGLHPLDHVVVRKEGYYHRCQCCGMQVDPKHPAHTNMEECRVGTAVTTSGTWQCDQHLPCASSSRCMGMF